MPLVNPVFLLFAGLVILALVPLLFVLWRVRTPRGRRASALVLHRAQLEELDRELDEGRIGAVEHAGAKLEVQRRLLAVGELKDETVTSASRGPLILALILVPLAAGGLYLIEGRPDMPSGLEARRDSTAPEAQEAERLITTLRSRLAALDPTSDVASQGYLLLGNAEASRGRLAEAAAAWRLALRAGFNPGLAAQAAEAQTQADGKVTDETKALFRRALAEAPPDAPWKALVEQRLK